MKRQIAQLFMVTLSILSAQVLSAMEKIGENSLELPKKLSISSRYINYEHLDDDEPAENECNICFEEKNDTHFRILTCCTKKICIECINRIRQNHHSFSCPFCRTEITFKNIRSFNSSILDSQIKSFKKYAPLLILCTVGLYWIYCYFTRKKELASEQTTCSKNSLQEVDNQKSTDEQ